MQLIIFLFGAAGYGMFEVAYRGYTHWTMMLTGGACLLTFYYLNREFSEIPVLLKAFCGMLIITVYEFFVGLIVNLWYGWHIWDYTSEPGNILGIICPRFCFYWFLLSLALCLLAEQVRSVPE